MGALGSCPSPAPHARRQEGIQGSVGHAEDGPAAPERLEMPLTDQAAKVPRGEPQDRRHGIQGVEPVGGNPTGGKQFVQHRGSPGSAHDAIDLRGYKRSTGGSGGGFRGREFL